MQDLEQNKDEPTVESVTALVAGDFGLRPQDILNEEQLLKEVADRVADLMANQMEFLLGMLYRLDVLEEKIKVALSPKNTEAPHIALARLIVDRQKQRLKSKMNSFKPLPDDMQDLAW